MEEEGSGGDGGEVEGVGSISGEVGGDLGDGGGAVKRGERLFFARASLLFFAECCALLCPRPTNSQAAQRNTESDEFQWNWDAQQELSAKDLLRKAKIPKADRKAIATVIAAQLRPMLKDLEIESEAGLEKTALDTRVKWIDLNNDGVREVIAQGMVNCSAVGNCPIWVFRKRGKGYQVLLEDEAQTFTIQKTSTGGYREIVTAVHGSATQAGLADYRFRDGRYQEAGCYSSEWAVLEGEMVRDLKEPQIRAFPCKKH